MITNIKTVAVYVSDQQGAVRFYTEQLGFTVRRSQPMGSNWSWIEVAPKRAKSRIVLYPRTMMRGWEGMKPSIVFGCKDTEATYKELSSKGVKFTQEPNKMPWGTFAKFADPDGNEFVLTEEN